MNSMQLKIITINADDDILRKDDMKFKDVGYINRKLSIVVIGR